MTGFRLTRRSVLAGGASGLLISTLPAVANSDGVPSHGVSAFGALKYSADFPHFDYVNPNAPKGGRVARTAATRIFNQSFQTFDTLNSFVFKGNSPPGIDICYDNLFISAVDEPASVYGLVASSIQQLKDGNTYRIKLRPEARFQDGTLVTSDDVIFSFNILKSDGHPDLKSLLRTLDSITRIDDHNIELNLAKKRSRTSLLAMLSEIPILSSNEFDGKDFTKTTQVAPIGSGPYRVRKFRSGHWIDYERVEDYWAKDLPVMRGKNNFDVIRMAVFRDRTTAFESFKKGELDIRSENVSANWAKAYTFPAFTEGKVIKLRFPRETRPIVQGWSINSRRSKFKDPRTRQAIALAFDYEWINQNMFYGAYVRSNSYFEGSIYKADGLPSVEELAILEPFRDQIPAAAFLEPYREPVSDGSGTDRKLLSRSSKLLKEAGWERREGALYNETGDKLSVEFLIVYAVFERVLGGFVANLKKLGIDAKIRRMDATAYRNRILDFDFDIVTSSTSFSPIPVEGMRITYGSKAANEKGSRNLNGIADPVVDAIIEQAEAAQTLDDLVIALKCLDRVLLAGHYSIPNWFLDRHRIAIWDRFGWPDTKPDYAFPILTTWWEDPNKPLNKA